MEQEPQIKTPEQQEKERVAKVIKDFLELLNQNKDSNTVGGCFGNTIRDIYSLAKRLGVENIEGLSDEKGWKEYCENPY